MRVHPQGAAGSAEVIVGSSPKHAGKLPHSDELRDAGQEGKEMGWTGRQRRGARYRSGEGIAKRRPGTGRVREAGGPGPATCHRGLLPWGLRGGPGSPLRGGEGLCEPVPGPASETAAGGAAAAAGQQRRAAPQVPGRVEPGACGPPLGPPPPGPQALVSLRLLHPSVPFTSESESKLDDLSPHPGYKRRHLLSARA